MKTCDWGSKPCCQSRVTGFPAPVWRCSRCSAPRRRFRRGDDRAGLDDLIAITVLGHQSARVSTCLDWRAWRSSTSPSPRRLSRGPPRLRNSPRVRGAARLPAGVSRSCRGGSGPSRDFRKVYRDKSGAIDDKSVVRTVCEISGLPAVTDENSGCSNPISPRATRSREYSLLLATPVPVCWSSPTRRRGHG